MLQRSRCGKKRAARRFIRALLSSACLNSRLILCLAWLALLAKLTCAALTRGTNDVDAFYNFGRFIWENGLLAQYRAAPEFNHTPLTGWFCALAYGLGKGIGFPLVLRLPGILADFAVIKLLLHWRKSLQGPPAWALALLTVSPVSFMVSGFHGNVDPVIPLLLVLAVWRSVRGDPWQSGLWLGLACNIKVVPLLLAPLLFFHWWARGKPLQFFLPAGLAIFVGWGFPLLLERDVFLRNVLGYSSNWGSWGVTYALAKLPWPELAPVGFSGLSQLQQNIMTALKLVIVGATLAVAWRRRMLPSETLFSSCALIWTIFFVFAPGVGAQYLVWFAPFLLLHSAPWFAVVTAASSLFVFAFYHVISGGFPWNHGHSTAELVPHWAPWSIVPWLALLTLLAGSVWTRETARAGSTLKT